MNILELYDIFLKYPKICIDSRSAEENSIFFAIKGKNFNGNEFAEEALINCEYAIVDEKKYCKNKKCILVNDALNALHALAAYHRKRLGLPILAITGTNGKTTTKELIIAVMSKKYKVTGTKGNLNNHIGVPLTLLNMTKDDEFGIIEMGANHIGEIETLCKIVAPDFGIITNIGRAHLEGFGSIEGVAQTKAELYAYLRENNGVVFINDDNEMLEDLNPPSDIISYGKQGFTHCQGKLLESKVFLKLVWYATNILDEDVENVNWNDENRILETKLIGNYNFENALAAICVGNNFGVSDIDIKNAIETYEPKNNRSQLIKTEKNILISDSYNANPTSMRISIENFLDIDLENKVLILGDMLELGSANDREHGIILSLIENKPFDSILLIGENFYKYADETNDNLMFFENINEVLKHIKNNTIQNKNILIKGSRGIGLDKLIELL